MIVATALRWLRHVATLALLVALALVVFLVVRPAPQDLPWTPLRLDQPPGLFTGRKLAALGRDAPACRALLRDAGLKFAAVPPHGSDQCRMQDSVRIVPRQDMLVLSPTVATACPVAAGLLLWQAQVVQPAAQRLLGTTVARIEHLGSYSCRRMYGRSGGSWSEHATGNAIDVSTFVLADGRRVSVLRDWSRDDARGRFLHAARDGSCRIFATVLSPDYNAAHRDHLHLDEADRGDLGWRACR
ncbi:extensin family protein [Sphingomonas sp. TREG-RG-20F-R18-01]|uniref:extensin-like domain-containing protein n=1 Tax=Sphingomonas sp. TREG-RG-20F-R18-01 TaxID=2914982 RepID=UPI001F55F671|nr:extensin family protein [Sphingomonas sp. TREG-RG-20F-R18-01]